MGEQCRQQFARRMLRNVRLHQSALAPVNLTTLPHFSVSSAISLPKSAREPASTVPPRSASRVFMLGRSRQLLARLRRSKIAHGLPLSVQERSSADITSLTPHPT